MPLALHLSFHLALAVLAGLLIGHYFKKPWLGIMAGILGGFFIDLDHVLEYFLVFGPHFNLWMFFNGRQFLASSQIHLWFHAWEYIPVLLAAAYFFRRKTVILCFILALTFGGFLHLISDCLMNQYPPRNYSLIYRWSRDFSTQRLLDPGQYQEYLHYKRAVGF